MTRPAVCPNAAPDLLPALSLYEGDNAKVTLELVTEDTLTFSLGRALLLNLATGLSPAHKSADEQTYKKDPQEGSSTRLE